MHISRLGFDIPLLVIHSMLNLHFRICGSSRNIKITNVLMMRSKDDRTFPNTTSSLLASKAWLFLFSLIFTPIIPDTTTKMASHSTSNPSTSISLPIPIPTSKSNLHLLPCDPLVDSPAILAQQIAAFSNPHEPFFFVLFPETEEKEKAVKRLVDNWVGDEKAKYVKVVDGDGMF